MGILNRFKELKKTEAQEKIADDNRIIFKEKKEELHVKTQIKNKRLKYDRYLMYHELTNMGFQFNNLMGIGKWVLFMDDINKLFVLNKRDWIIPYRFSDLLNFEFNEDGNSSVVGTTVTEKTNYMAIKLFFNHVENSELTIELIKRPKRKDSRTYIKKRKEAQEAMELLTYIQKNA